ncbi:hypothetical protein [Streptomyces peucetius]
MGFSSYVLGETSRGLMRTAREFMAQESKLVAQLLGKQLDLTVGRPGGRLHRELPRPRA